jgi:hypothetical protein
LFLKYLDKEFGGVPTSTFNTTGDYIFHQHILLELSWLSENKSARLSSVKSLEPAGPMKKENVKIS